MRETIYQHKGGHTTKTEKETFIRWAYIKDSEVPLVDWATFDLDLRALSWKYTFKTMLAIVFLPVLVLVSKFRSVRF